jgi:hypothetical protein
VTDRAENLHAVWAINRAVTIRQFDMASEALTRCHYVETSIHRAYFRMEGGYVCTESGELGSQLRGNALDDRPDEYTLLIGHVNEEHLCPLQLGLHQ